MTQKNDDQKSPWEDFIKSLDGIDDLEKLCPEILDTEALDEVTSLIERYNLPRDENAIMDFVDFVDCLKSNLGLKISSTFYTYLQALMWERIYLSKNTKPLEMLMSAFIWGIVFATLGRCDIEEIGE